MAPNQTSICIMIKNINTSFLGEEKGPTIEKKNAFFSHCFEVLYMPVLAISCSFFNNEKEAEDCTIDFFEKLMHWPIARFKNPKNLTGYILKSAYNHCVTAYEKKKRPPLSINIDDVFEIKQRQKGIDETLIIKERLEDVQKLIVRLSKPQQKVLKLYSEGYSHQEISTILDISISTSTSRLNRARENLRRMLQNQLVEAEKPSSSDG